MDRHFIWQQQLLEICYHNRQIDSIVPKYTLWHVVPGVEVQQVWPPTRPHKAGHAKRGARGGRGGRAVHRGHGAARGRGGAGGRGRGRVRGAAVGVAHPLGDAGHAEVGDAVVVAPGDDGPELADSASDSAGGGSDVTVVSSVSDEESVDEHDDDEMGAALDEMAEIVEKATASTYGV